MLDSCDRGFQIEEISVKWRCSKVNGNKETWEKRVVSRKTRIAKRKVHLLLMTLQY